MPLFHFLPYGKKKKKKNQPCAKSFIYALYLFVIFIPSVIIIIIIIFVFLPVVLWLSLESSFGRGHSVLATVNGCCFHGDSQGFHFHLFLDNVGDGEKYQHN